MPSLKRAAVKLLRQAIAKEREERVKLFVEEESVIFAENFANY
jgi:hypothetical protein